MNQICLYSNGLGVFQREYALESGQPLRIAIPVPTITLDEAIASIGVFGEVTLNEPPSFAPINSQPRGITLDANDVIKDIARKMRGAVATVQTATETVRGILAGLQEYYEDTETPRNRFQLVLFEEDGTMRSVNDEAILSLKFADTAVQAEIEKALRRAFEQVKPDSSYINLMVTPNTPETKEVFVQYTLANMGAWKIGYRLRSQAGKWELEGQAVVDNCTDEGWENVLISVVTGQPISFATDLAEIRLVHRDKENIVSDQALGAYTMQDAMPETAKFFRSAPASGVAYSLSESTEAIDAMFMAKRATQETAEVKETSEIVEYTARRPVTIAANQSAVIPMFETPLEDAKKLLVYNQTQHPSRPYRAIEFSNEADHALGKGVVTLFEDGNYIGKAILKEMGTGEKQILPYALEARVKIGCETGGFIRRIANITISEGVAIAEHFETETTVYHIENLHKEPFTLDIEHGEEELGDFEVHVSTKETPEITPIEEGKRLRLTLPASEAVHVTCKNSHVCQQSLTLADASRVDLAIWSMFAELVYEARLADNPVIQVCIRLQKERDAMEKQIRQNVRATETIVEEQKRLKELIRVGGLETDMDEWRRDLGTNERKIRELKALQTELQGQAEAIKARLQEALAGLALTWQAAANP